VLLFSLALAAVAFRTRSFVIVRASSLLRPIAARGAARRSAAAAEMNA
jgi:hypothetical protein